MEVLALAVMGMVNIFCFIAGAKVGLAVRKGKDIDEEFRPANPIERYKENKVKQEAQKEQDRMNTILENIEAYDGTSFGQKEVR